MDDFTQEECAMLRMWCRSLVVHQQSARSHLMADECTDRSPLHVAAFQGQLINMQKLVAQGYDIETLTMDNVSPLHEACLGGHYYCVKYLLDKGADVDRVTMDGATPLFFACSSGKAACVQLILQSSSSLCFDESLSSPVHEAAEKNHTECLKLLLSCDAPIDFELPGIGTPLYCACMSQAADCVELLLRSGADVQLGCGQDSPLHGAVRGRDARIVKLLLDFGGDECCRNADGETPLEVSEEKSAARATLQARDTCSLTQLCRVSIRRRLGRSQLHLISTLPLPPRIQDFLQYQ